MCFIFLTLFLFLTNYASDNNYICVNNDEFQNNHLFYKKTNLNPHDIEKTDNNVFEKKDLFNEISGIIKTFDGNLQINNLVGCGSFSSFVSILPNLIGFGSSFFYNNFWQYGITSISQLFLNLTSTGQVFNFIHIKRKERVGDFLQQLFNDEQLKSKKFLSVGEIKNKHESIISMIKKEYSEISFKETMGKIFPLATSLASILLSVGSIKDISERYAVTKNPDVVGTVLSQGLNLATTSIALICYITNCAYNNRDQKIEEFDKKLKELLKSYECEV